MKEQLLEILKSVSAAHEQATLLPDKAPVMVDVKEMALLLISAQTIEDFAEAIRKHCKGFAEDLEKKVGERLQQMGLEGIEAAGHRFKLKQKDLFCMPKEGSVEYSELLHWLQENQGGGLVKPHVSFSTFNAFCEELLAKGMELPPHVHQYPRTGVSVRRIGGQ